MIVWNDIWHLVFWVPDDMEWRVRISALVVLIDVARRQISSSWVVPLTSDRVNWSIHTVSVVVLIQGQALLILVIGVDDISASWSHVNFPAAVGPTVVGISVAVLVAVQVPEVKTFIVRVRVTISTVFVSPVASWRHS